MVYPKWLYHKEEEPMLVKSKEQHEALGDEWKESPADFPAEEEGAEKPKRRRKAE